ncbi:SpoIIE family protein phosphatase [Leptolyngbya sp. FACHB-36]|uniref:PP2C family protein-serine/threonine phosphatase n=1 Tax=Leptolyngbya sp. FACHB-36 TaxID=2692808 RepID=UPI001680D982|nr:SpoIIE family protein phosphatase [Leptolyngbya sp. FACHB-36]MBD2020054.1 SpoIIE family protein phosphatase [Leptolyngbya sp. FACHB-36]
MPTVLIIDDDLATQVILQKALGNQGYTIAVAADGLEGIAKAKELCPALIICDWNMPHLDGLEVCRRIKADPALSSAFFVLLTARSAIEDRVRGLDNGADDFLAKPIEISELQARVRAGLRLQRTNQDLQAQKRMLESEFAEAAEYVRSLLPPPMHGSVAIDSRFIPSRQLGGDCFDYYWLDPDYLAIYLLDVSGHGLGAALPSIAVLNLLRSQSMDGVNFYQPNLVLSALNEAFQMDNQNDKYFTIWYGVYNRIKRQLIYSSAGHPPAILLSETRTGGAHVQQLKTSSLPIGMLPDTRFFNQRCEIEAASTLYVFSDGIYEIHQSDGMLWGLDAFMQLLVNDETAIKQVGLDRVLDYVKQINVRDALDDDLSLLRIQFN